MKTRKVAVAMFVGGFLGFVVACIFAPRFWWLGTAAGFAAGYISYEFREFLAAIPEAWHSSCAEVDDWWFRNKNYILRPHPFLMFGFVAALPCAGWIGYKAYGRMLWNVEEMVVFLAVSLAFYLFGALVSALLSYVLVYLSVNKDRIYSADGLVDMGSELSHNAYIGKPLSYSVAGKHMAIGFCIVAKFVLLAIPRHALAFAWHMFKLVNSEERVLCGIYGAVGATVAYRLLRQSDMATAEVLVCAIFSMFSSTMIGVLHYMLWEEACKRFHIEPANANAVA